MKKVVFTFLFGFLFFTVSHGQFNIPEKPAKQTCLYDYVGLLNSSATRFLKEKLIRYSDSTSTQIVTIIIESTNGDDILELATRWGNRWGIGQKGKDNGIVLLMARSDRTIAISTGKGIEKELSNSRVKRIINSRIVPEFKKGNYYDGFSKGVEGIFESLNGTFQKRKEAKDSWFRKNIYDNIEKIAFFVLMIVAFVLKGLDSKDRNYFEDDSNDYWESDRSFRWRFSDSTDSFDNDFDNDFDGGFGGGSFGGGGASGSW